MDHREALRRLQETDIAIFKAQRRVDEHRDKIKKAEANLAKTSKLVEVARAGVDAAVKKVRDKEGEVALLRAKREPLVKKLNQAANMKMAEAAQKQIATLDGQIEALEEQALELMEAEEEARGLLEQASGGVKKLEAMIAEAKAGEAGVIEQVEVDVAKHQEDRLVWLKRADEKDVSEYEKLYSKKPGKRVVAEVEESCGVCDYAFTEDEQMTLMRTHETVSRCKICKALLIYVGAQKL